MTIDVSTIFFDLDHTLFDYDAAKERAVIAAFAPVLARFPTADYALLRANYDIAMQQAEAEGKMWGVSYLTPDRFRDTLRLSGIADASLVETMAETYWRVFHAEPSTFPDAEPALLALQGRFRLGLITNGHPGPQRKTIEISGLAHLLEPDLIIISGEVGVHKPDRALFDEAVRRGGAPAGRTLLVGDNPVNDIDGAARAGLRTVWVCRNGATFPDGLAAPDAAVKDLTELLSLIGA
jgi:HAD superfamily hydrolase (TIGR01549 family)